MTSVDMQCDVEKITYHVKFTAKSMQSNGWPLYNTQGTQFQWHMVNPLNAELNPNCHLLALVGAHHIVHVSRVRVKRE
jgi:hypothetical protein